jgi:hypothetical protein
LKQFSVSVGGSPANEVSSEIPVVQISDKRNPAEAGFKKGSWGMATNAARWPHDEVTELIKSNKALMPLVLS